MHMKSRKRLKHFTYRGDQQRIREDLLRPNPYLGYECDRLGLHFLQCEAFQLAESQFRRAAWLNPHEPLFTLHLAHALLRLRRMDEAHLLLIELRRDSRTRSTASELFRRYWPDDP